MENIGKVQLGLDEILALIRLAIIQGNAHGALPMIDQVREHLAEQKTKENEAKASEVCAEIAKKGLEGQNP